MANQIPPAKLELVLTESDIYGVRGTAKRWGISERSISRYRAKMLSDPILAESVEAKKRALLKSWENECTRAMAAGFNRLADLMANGSSSDCDLIHSIAGALKICGELKIKHAELEVTADALGVPMGEESEVIEADAVPIP
jgi:hypothetical protein